MSYGSHYRGTKNRANQGGAALATGGAPPVSYQRVASDIVQQAAMRDCLLMHLTKPWINNFKDTLIRPLRPHVDPQFFDVAQGTFHDTTTNLDWYKPSRKFWETHCEASHGPQGQGCSVDQHVRYLTEEGEDAELAYAALLQDHTLYVLKKEDFQVECAYWSKAMRGK